MTEFRAFINAIGADWIGRMAGGAGLVLTVLAFFIPTEWQQLAFVSMGVLCLFYATYHAWLLQRRQYLQLLERFTPKLKFIHVPGEKPYFEETLGEKGRKLRSLRVGLRNLGGADIAQARVVLADFEPRTPSAVHLEHELQPMGKPDGSLAVALQAFGTVMIDVAREVVMPEKSYGTFHLCYAQSVQNDLPDLGDERYHLCLRAEGGGQVIHCKLDLGGRLSWRMDALTPLPGEELPK